MTKIGRLKKLHKKSLSQISQLTGLSRSYISQACSGERNVGRGSALKFLKAFQTMDLFLTLDDLV